MNGLSLFTGIGGIDVALSNWVEPRAYCEIEPYCQSVLLQRMQEGNLPKAPIWDDIRTLSSKELPRIDIIYGGFPCQNISVAGGGAGLEGKQSRLFFEIMRLVREIHPTFVFLENTKGILSRGGSQVVDSLASIGYNVRWITKSCREEGAPQHRERWFCLAHSNSQSNQRLPSGKEKSQSKSRVQIKSKKWNDWPKNESPLLRVDDVIPFRMDRAKALGNSVCIQQVTEAFKELLGI